MHNAGSGSKHNHKDVKRTKGRPTAGERPRSETQRQGKQAAIGGVLYFADGATQLTKAHEKQVQHAVEEIAGKPQRIEVRGHTARRPLTASGPPRDNWDLAYARCRTTMDQLVKGGIDPRRIRLGVAADNEPLNGGEDALSLSQSARVEIFLLDEFVDREEVEQAAPPRVAPAPAATP
jgi:chemotaxis protein MotB